MLLRYKLYEKYSIEELTERIKVETDSKKHSEISHAITFHLIDKKKQNGNFVKSDGYSGRKSK